MPRKAKDEKVIEETKATKKTPRKKAVTSTTTPKKTTTKKSAAKVTAKTKTASDKAKTTTAKKTSVAKKETKKTVTKKTTVPKKEANKKITKAEPKAKKVAAKVKSTTTKKTTIKTKTAVKKVTKKKTSTTKKVAAKPSKAPEIIEYYDLPYKYNKTVVKLLAQTPTTLFVYWEISDNDKEEFIKTYGQYFFNNTKPVLVIHNRTLGYDFEIDINDFANCWYIRVNDSNSDYEIELGRRPVNNYVTIENDYLFISNSNQIESPNDHILFENLTDAILFRNVKTGESFEKAFNYYLDKLKSIYNIKEFYRTMYKDEDFDFDRLTLRNPSSSSPTY